MRKITRTFYQALKIIATHARVAKNNKGQACLVIHAFLITKHKQTKVVSHNTSTKVVLDIFQLYLKQGYVLGGFTNNHFLETRDYSY